jgi:hypothetical protein
MNVKLLNSVAVLLNKILLKNEMVVFGILKYDLLLSFLMFITEEEFRIILSEVCVFSQVWLKYSWKTCQWIDRLLYYVLTMVAY